MLQNGSDLVASLVKQHRACPRSGAQSIVVDFVKFFSRQGRAMTLNADQMLSIAHTAGHSSKVGH
jgi:hypothetical protein